jgi:hypothetical protein
MKPIATLCLDTVNAKKKDELPQSERIFLRTDYSNLKNLQNQLEAALAEVDSVHCSRIQRYMR